MIGDNANADIMGASQFNMLTLQKKHQGVSISKNATYVFENYIELRNGISWLK